MPTRLKLVSPTTDFRRVALRGRVRPVRGATFEHWVGKRSSVMASTNAGDLPFQRWHRFKEAFDPELIARAVRESPRPVRNLADPFGGSGTSALAAQFLGVTPTTVEVNPFLADVIQAKVATYHVPTLISALTHVCGVSRRSRSQAAAMIDALPATFIEPGVKGRWLFDHEVALEILRLRTAILQLEDASIARLFRVILGGLMTSFSNATVSGKGRRYRVNWETRPVDPRIVLAAFSDAAAAAIAEIDMFADRPVLEATVLCADSRAVFETLGPVDLIVCSPPYPNSFDYTDVYNLELWMLGYLGSTQDNRALRQSTLTSHVQVSRTFAAAPSTPTLNRTMKALHSSASQLWDHRIPAMVGGYFADLLKLLRGSAHLLPPGGQAWFVVGDSQYARVRIQVARILAELAPRAGFDIKYTTPFRSMRVSPQQSGRPGLSEDLVVMTRR